MRFALRSTVLAAGLLMAAAAPSSGQQAGSLAADLLNDVKEVEQKLVGLAQAIPADKYAWAPGAGVRSVGEVLLHVGADTYLMPGGMGFAVDPATGIVPSDYKTAGAFEKRKLTKEQTIAELQKSFAFMKQSLSASDAAKMSGKVTLFGQSFTGQQAWIMATTHLHEHLGQLIAYARSNGVKPP